MQKLIHLILLISIVGGVVLMRPTPVGACSCAKLPYPRQLYKNVDVVFIGTAESFRRPSPLRLFLLELYDYFSPPLPRIRHYTTTAASAGFIVDEAWKGLDSRAVTILTAPSTGGCGIMFQPGKRYLVYGYTNVFGEISAHSCSGTSQISFLDDNPDAHASTQTLDNLAYLETLTPLSLPPASTEAESTRLWWVLGSIIILVGIGAWLVRRRRSQPPPPAGS